MVPATLPGASFTDTALTAGYLRRLGYGDEKAAQLAGAKALGSPVMDFKEIVTELVGRHVMRVPFENFDLCADPSKFHEAIMCRIANPREIVRRLAFGVGGGTCFDLSPAFAWLLTQLGAKARLVMACDATADGYSSTANRLVVIADNPGQGSLLTDVCAPEPCRTAVDLSGESSDALATYDVVSSGEAEPAGFVSLLRRRRAAGSIPFSFETTVCAPEQGEAPKEEELAAWTPVYAFCPEQDLASGADEIKTALAAISNPASTLAKQRLFSLAMPNGFVVLTDAVMRQVSDGNTVHEEAVSDADAWTSCLDKILSQLYEDPPMDAVFYSKRGGGRDRSPDGTPIHNFRRSEANITASEQMQKAYQSQEGASQRSKHLGSTEASSLAVGGAGAGGGLGLNKPGFGPKVHHFSGSGQRCRTINISDDIPNAWAQIMDDQDPIGWMLCEYQDDGKTLDLKSKGGGGLASFKASLGDAIAWGGFRCYAVDRRGGVDCKRIKLVFVQYRPDSAPAMKKAKQSSHKGDVKDVLTGAHLDITVENPGELDEQELITKMQDATGAHKPNGYEFEAGVFLEADFYGTGIGKECKNENSKN
mmetsp:Transcript_52676/g.104631  ORF Transcript_52676/g.104631 Transcript_52676/m.104631 type:complete len:592 (-) Transcript_52676:153-1928(-)